MRFLLFTALLLSAFSQITAQLTLSSNPSSERVTTSGYRFATVIDSTQTRIIGKLLNKDKVTYETLRLDATLPQFFRTSLKNVLNPGSDSTEIALVVRQLSISERPVGNFLEGKITLEVAFLRLRGNDSTFLVSTTATSGYQRTYGSVPVRNLEQLVQKNLQTAITFFNRWVALNRRYVPAFATSSNVIILPAYAKNEDDTVYHPTRKITWNDFKGTPALGSGRFDAAIFASIGYELEITVDNQVVVAKFTPKVYMVKGMSWVRATNLSAYSLAHEQLHFDIAQVAMNRYVKRIQQIRETTPEELQGRIQYEYLEAFREMNRLQEAYDDETGHGVIALAQREWQQQVADWLK